MIEKKKLIVEMQEFLGNSLEKAETIEDLIEIRNKYLNPIPAVLNARIKKLPPSNLQTIDCEKKFKKHTRIFKH